MYFYPTAMWRSTLLGILRDSVVIFTRIFSACTRNLRATESLVLRYRSTIRYHNMSADYYGTVPWVAMFSSLLQSERLVESVFISASTTLENEKTMRQADTASDEALSTCEARMPMAVASASNCSFSLLKNGVHEPIRLIATQSNGCGFESHFDG